MVQVRIRSSKSWSPPASLLSMSTEIRLPTSFGVLKRILEGFHAPSCASILIVHEAPVTSTGATAPETTCVPLPTDAPAIVKRCGKEAFLDLTETVHAPCIASDMSNPLQLDWE